MSDVPPKKDAIAILMSNATRVCPPDDPWYTAVLYEAHLEHVDESEPLWRVPYFGQVVRVGTAEEVFAKRKREHETDTIRDPKDLGFHAVIGMFGADKIEWRVLSSQPGRRSEVQAWANAEEIRLIAEHGGVLRDMDAKLTQTLNLTKGGKWGDPAAVWAGIESRRNRALTKFKAAMEAYVEEQESALVPINHVDDDGYRLGAQLNNFRQGRMRKGMSNEADIVAWAEALPKWAWNGHKTDKWRKEKSQHFKDIWKNATEEQYVNRIAKQKATNATDESKAKRSKSAKNWHATELRAELERARQIAVPFEKSNQRRAELRAASTDFSGKVGNAVLYMISKDGETIRRVKKTGTIGKAEIVGPVVDSPVAEVEAGPSDLNAAYVSAKLKATKATDESNVNRRKNYQTARRRAELERARPIAVLFERSKKRRAEMRAASTDFSGKQDNAVLYMISKDGKTIQRVTTQGAIGKVQIVGPVVDPPVAEAAGPSDLNAAYVSDLESD